MPVTTETFWNIKKLNVIFLFSSGILVACTLWFILADYTRDWQGYQKDARVWETALTTTQVQQAITPAAQQRKVALEKELVRLRASLPHAELKQLTLDLNNAKKNAEKQKLRLAVLKGQIGPKEQQIERAVLDKGKKSKRAKARRIELESISRIYDALYAEVSALKINITDLSAKLRKKQRIVAETQKRIAAIGRVRNAKLEILSKVNPQGLHWVDEQIRNIPLLDWLNPSLKVKQVVVPDVRTDYNFVQTETIDRCATCHVNIAKPAFSEPHITAFMERQVAQSQGQRFTYPQMPAPVVMLDFWVNAAEAAGHEFEFKLDEINKQALVQFNAMRTQSKLKPLTNTKQLIEALDDIVRHQSSVGGFSIAQWYQQARNYVDSLQSALASHLKVDTYRNLREVYRYALINKFNKIRTAAGLPAVSTDRVLLGHPRGELFVDVESKHPMSVMGCTVCHEGAGQETDFTHATHIPRDIWVDAKTGAPLPEMLIDHRIGSQAEIGRLIRHSKARKQASSAAYENDETQHAKPRYSHDDISLLHPDTAAPFAPKASPHGDHAAYKSLVDGSLRLAIKQSAFWTKRYNWNEVHYTHWEKPMNSMTFIESSCIKCHTEVYDIEKEAPKVFEGRKLFAQLGCINCHSIDSVKNADDIKRVGPSLVNVKNKLSPKMMASWIWAPKAFRPTTRMPHYFMLENNSAPVDILRTRVEVAGITYYLQNVKPASGTPEYIPEPSPEMTGDITRGRDLFKSVGCFACHTNLAETGEQWIVQDLKERKHLGAKQAKQAYQSLTYNQQHWYVMEHLEDKLNLIGPELSGVGTKLKTGRTEQQAKAWLYDWLRNPRHYSSYSIMPRFRLSPQEANDLSAYLLSQERPNYQAQDFLKLNAPSKEMLTKLVAQLAAGQMTVEMSERHVRKTMSQDQQLFLLGKKMVGNYGCNGCHLISGFEAAPSTCADLDGWGLKNPHKIAFGYFDPAFDQSREHTIPVFKTTHEGLKADAPSITDKSDKIQKIKLTWEHLEINRRAWLYQKLHNPRVYDRGKTILNGELSKAGIKVGRPYDKLRMPKFFLKDRQVEALVTFVTGIREPLVSKKLLDKTYSDAKRRYVRGRQIATKYNCYGCHNIEGNNVAIQAYYKVHNPDGTVNDNNMNWAPPRLIGQGSKTQPDWLFNFLQNVRPIRPWLQVRMPSFPLTSNDAKTIVDFFASHTEMLSKQLGSTLTTIETYLQKTDALIASKQTEMATVKKQGADHFVQLIAKEIEGLQAQRNNWFDVDSKKVADAVLALAHFANEADLATAADLDSQLAQPTTRRENWNKVLNQVRILAKTWQTNYPYVEHYAPQASQADIARGERLFTQMGCMTGLCHRMGDEKLLDQAGLLLSSKKKEDDQEDDGYGDDDNSEDGGYGDDDDAVDEVQDVSVAPQVAPSGAPNLGNVYERLQRHWVTNWVSHAATIQPGTRMQQFWANNDSFFKPFPKDMRTQKESLFGYTSEQQRNLILQFLYAAGRKHLTYNTTGGRLGGGPAQKIKLETLAPKQAATKEPSAAKPKATIAKPKVAYPVKPVDNAALKASQKKASQAYEPVSSTIQLQNTPTAAFDGTRIVGTVKYAGKARRRKRIRFSADPVCDQFHRKINHKQLNEKFVVGPNGEFQNVFIYVKSGLPQSAKIIPTKPAILDQHGCMYHPHILGIVAGQSLRILNSDGTLHNVKMASKKNGKFNEGMPVKGMKIDKKLSTPELGIKLKCDIHPWMGGLIHVIDNPFFAVSDIQGRFEIKGLPAGKYTLEAVHENSRIKPVVFEVIVKNKTSVRANVTLSR